MHRCAFLTLEDPSNFCIYDHLLLGPLAALGWAVEEIPWDRPGVEWSAFDAVVVRSTWDYQKDPDSFLEVLRSIESRTRLYNPLSVCRWNLNKRYLQSLCEKGVCIVPTQWLDKLTTGAIQAAFTSAGCDCLVAKPLVGANADDTFVLRASAPEAWGAAISVFKQRALMLQPFVESIHSEGEYSLFYFGGELSHAIVKRPADGDFRVQEEHGGVITPVDPAPDIVEAAAIALGAIEEILLYARVDLVRLAGGQPALMEMELIEPSLYFEQCVGSAEKFARAFVEMASA
ncbi:MAG: RimK family alpha-L-glutamate ligase [Congregibacter sp.]